MGRHFLDGTRTEHEMFDARGRIADCTIQGWALCGARLPFRGPAPRLQVEGPRSNMYGDTYPIEMWLSRKTYDPPIQRESPCPDCVAALRDLLAAL